MCFNIFSAHASRWPFVCPMRRVHEGARAVAEDSKARGPGIEPGAGASVAKVQAIVPFQGSR